ncbi:MAG: glutamate synthase subunit alpha, partial [Bdellovibrionota bacterium]
KARTLDLSSLLITPTSIIPNVKTVNRHMEKKKIETLPSIDDTLIEVCSETLHSKYPTRTRLQVRNTDHTIGTKLSSEIARRYGSRGLPDESIVLDLDGTCGQSLGAFLSRGITLRLHGDANDYVGKGLSGGRIVVNPPWSDPDGTGQVVAGNACLYGATAGKAFFRGKVGERFAVRNSGAVAVVEGTGDHACEYMTGGEVVVLGETGRNFAAGMSGGHAYVYDHDGTFKSRVGSMSVELSMLEESGRELELRRLIELHAYETGSAVARAILTNWAVEMKAFVVVTPLEYKSALLGEQRKKLQRILAVERAPAYG